MNDYHQVTNQTIIRIRFRFRNDFLECDAANKWSIGHLPEGGLFTLPKVIKYFMARISVFKYFTERIPDHKSK
uniref:Uncharacterized protein n=1 Tax=Onchocerca volvulus TaxID=6282 RepID=A0A8R1TQY6_ONCVO